MCAIRLAAFSLVRIQLIAKNNMAIWFAVWYRMPMAWLWSHHLVQRMNGLFKFEEKSAR